MSQIQNSIFCVYAGSPVELCLQTTDVVLSSGLCLELNACKWLYMWNCRMHLKIWVFQLMFPCIMKSLTSMTRLLKVIFGVYVIPRFSWTIFNQEFILFILYVHLYPFIMPLHALWWPFVETLQDFYNSSAEIRCELDQLLQAGKDLSHTAHRVKSFCEQGYREFFLIPIAFLLEQNVNPFILYGYLFFICI